ncbi:MAG: hypothetical protein CME36_02615 [unclassified Hahellaceae]|jgi:hypothetical protein|nr:hypothetical protein [Hahellaceae bacterium]|tara:strand:+ start:15171 stop:15398 length:228 start_codon:yes stop_codon:yes gene_type:complete
MPAEEMQNREAYIMSQAYQVIAQIALAADLFENDDVQRALDYFSTNEYREDFLPFPSTPMTPSNVIPPENNRGFE